MATPAPNPPTNNNNSTWRTPAAITALVGVVVALAGLYFQQRNLELEEKRQKDADWAAYQELMHKEDAIKKFNDGIDASIYSLDQEIEQLDRDIERAMGDRNVASWTTKSKNVDAFDNTKTQEERDAAVEESKEALRIMQNSQNTIDELVKKKEKLKADRIDLVKSKK